jgi:hypothetical protein
MFTRAHHITILSQFNPIHNLKIYKIWSTLINTEWVTIRLSSHLTWNFKMVLSFRLPNENYVHILCLPNTSTSPVHLILLDLTNVTKYSKQYKLVSSALQNFLQPPVTSYFVCPNTLICILFTMSSICVLPFNFQSPVVTICTTCFNLYMTDI